MAPKRKKRSEKKEEEEVGGEETKSLFETSYYDIKYKDDVNSRPILVFPNYRLVLETFSPYYKQAYDFLIAIADPISRPKYIHEYKLTEYSLYAAVSIGLKSEEIIETLDKFSKTDVPKEVKDFIIKTTKCFGKVKLVLRESNYYLESREPNILLQLLRYPEISSNRDLDMSNQDIDKETGFTLFKHRSDITLGVGLTGPASSIVSNADNKLRFGIEQNYSLSRLQDDDDDMSEANLYSFKIKKTPTALEHVKKCCIEHDLPALEEYDFINDTRIENMPIDLKTSTTLRDYQIKSLSKMFENGRARSGTIVLPCGAGKTLVGVTASSTIKKRTIVLTTNCIAVDQWRNQFLMWSTIPANLVTSITSNPSLSHLDNDMFKPGYNGVVITTYSMINHKNNMNRSENAKKLLEVITKSDWGLLLLDEVHDSLAEGCRKIFGMIPCHCKLGLTATMVREDKKIEDLNFLLGTKLYEANWIDLAKAGHIASVCCCEIQCEMSPEFMEEYLEKDSKEMDLIAMNPNKFRTCQFLIDYHEKRGDKIIVFADRLVAVEYYSKALHKHCIFGKVSMNERNEILQKFRNPASDVNTIILSTVGDAAIDVPDANVVIQISSHFGGRRQEAQRMGRILRPKPAGQGEFNAYFYTLVSKHTVEMKYASKRQLFLIKQGYSYKVVTEIPEMASADLKFGDAESRRQLLDYVRNRDPQNDTEIIDEDDVEHVRSRKSLKFRTSTAGLSGATNRGYKEKKIVPNSIFYTSPTLMVKPPRKKKKQ